MAIPNNIHTGVECKVSPEQCAALAQTALLTEADLSGNFIYANTAFCNLTGYTPQELEGKNHRILRSDAHPTDFFEQLWATLRAKQTWQGTLKNKKKDGSIYWAATTISPIVDANGTIIKYISVAYDISAQVQNIEQLQLAEAENADKLQKLKQRESSVNRIYAIQQALMNTPSLGIIVTNLEGLIITINAGTESLLGYKPEQLIKRTTPLLFHTQAEVFQRAQDYTQLYGIEPDAGFETLLAPLKNSDYAPQSWQLTRKDGKTFAAEVVLNTIIDPTDKHIGYLYMFQSVQVQKDAVADTLMRLQQLDAQNLQLQDLEKELRQSIAEYQTEINLLKNEVAELASLRTEVAEKDAQIQNLAAFQDAMSHSAGLAMIITNNEGTIQRFNTAAEQMLGYKAEELVGRLSPAVFHDLKEIVDRAYQLTNELGRQIFPGFEVFTAIAQTGVADTRVWTYIRKDGSRLPVELTITALRCPQGGILGYIGIAQDVSARKENEEKLINQTIELEKILQEKSAQEEELRQNAEELMAVNEALEEKTRLAAEQTQTILAREEALRQVNAFQRTLLDSAGLGIFTTKPDGTIIAFNDAAEQLLGYSEDEILTQSQNFSIFFDLNDIVAKAKKLSQDAGRTIFPGQEIFTYYPNLGKTDVQEWHFIRKDGSRFIGEMAYSAARDENNEIVAYIGVVRDVTEQKQNARLFEQLLEANPVPVVVSEVHTGIIKFANSAAAEVVQVPKNELIGAPTPDFYVYPEQRKQILEIIKKEGKIQNFEVELKKADDSVFSALFFGEIILINNTPHIYVGILDITERKKMEADIKQNEKRFRALFESSAEAIQLTNATGFLDVNEASVKMFGYASKEEVIGLHPGHLSPEYQPNGKRSYEYANELIENAIKHGYARFEWMHKRKNGETFPAEVLLCVYEVNDERILQASVQDITERKRLENELHAAFQELQAREEEIRQNLEETAAINDQLTQTIDKVAENERFLQTVLDALPVGFVCKEAKEGLRFTMANKRAQEILSLSQDKIIGTPLKDLVPEEIYADLLEANEKVITTRKLIEIPVLAATFGNGQKHYIHTTKAPVFDKDGNVRYVVSIWNDVSQRKKAELQLHSAFQELQAREEEIRQNLEETAAINEELERTTAALAEKEQFLNSVLDNLPVALTCHDVQAQYKFTIWNQQAETMFGHPKEQVLGKNIQDLFAPEAVQVFEAASKQAATERKQVEIAQHSFYSPTLGDIWLHTKEVPVLDTRGNTRFVISISENISERVQAQEALEKSRARLEDATAMARLATWEIDLTTNVINLDDRNLEILGTSIEIEGKRSFDIMNEYLPRFTHPEDYQIIAKEIQEAVAKRDPDYRTRFVYRALTLQGETRYLEVFGRIKTDQDGNPIIGYGTTQDITEQRAMEAVVLADKAVLDAALKIANLGTWSLDLNTLTLSLDDRHLEMMEIDKELPFERNLNVLDFFATYVYPDDQADIQAQLQDALTTQDRNWGTTFEYRLITVNGGIKSMLVNTRIVFDGDKPARAYGTTQDISDRKAYETAIIESQNQISEAFSIAKLAHWEYYVEMQLFQFTDHLFNIVGTSLEVEESYIITQDDYFNQFIHPADRDRVRTEMNAFLQSTDLTISTVAEYRIIRKDNQEVRYVSTNVRFTVQDGKAIGLFGTLQDITERKLADDAIRSSQALLSQAMKIANLAPWRMDIENQVLIMNDDAYRILGTTVEKEGGYLMFPDRYRSFMHPEDRHYWGKNLPDVLASTQAVNQYYNEYRIIRPNGEIAYVGVSFVGVKDLTTNEITQIYGTTQDITRRKLDELIIRENQARLGDAMDIASLGTFTADSMTQTITLDDRLLKLLNAQTEHLNEKNEISLEDFINTFVHPHDIGILPESMLRSFATQDEVFRDTFELRTVNRQGEIKYFLISVRVIRNEYGEMRRAVGVAQDITERKVEEIKRLERQERIQKQDAALSRLAKSDILTSGNLKAALDELTKVVADTVDVARVGLWLYGDEKASIICANLYEQKTSTYSEGIELFAHDYPNYFRAIDEEKVIAAKYATIDPRTNEFTDGYLSVLGISSMLDVPVRRGGKMIGVICNEHIGLAREWHDDEINFAIGVADLIALAMEANERQRALDELKRKEAELEKTVSERTDALESLKKTQTMLLQSEKMASLGALIAGVAHEVNTPISAVKASARNIVRGLPAVLTEVPLLLKALPDDDNALFMRLVNQSTENNQELTTQEERQYRMKVRKVLEEYDVDNASDLAKELVEIRVIENIEDYIPLFHHELSPEILDKVYKLGQFKKNLDNIDVAADKTARVVRALKNYSRVQTSERFTEAFLHDSIDTILTVYANQLKYGVAVEKNFEKLKPIPVYHDEIGQVWTNIINNAVQAMKGKGKIVIDIFKHDEQFAAVRITDSGPGIPPDILPRIFEPFFTTKPQGEGTGLGLDICKKIVEKHNGKLTVDTEPGRTSFTIYLPFVQPDEMVDHSIKPLVFEEEEEEA